MRIGIYSPYLDTLSGGERYVLTLAEHWSECHSVFVFWDDNSIVESAKKRLHIDLSKAHIVSNIFKKSLLKKLYATKDLDVLFFLSDGSVPLSFAKKTILHFQVPFSHVSITPLKSSRVSAVVCNSRFTQTHLDTRVGKHANVIYPPVNLEVSKTVQKKEKIIFSVGRFHPLKKQDILIRAFTEAQSDGQLKNWRLVLAGGLLQSDIDYFENLQKMSNPNIEFYPKCSYEKLLDFYGRASLYWHATGYDETEPANTEHFGIAPVEAMAAGCIPFVYNGGGLPEIIHDGIDGYLWSNTQELLEKTRDFINTPSTDSIKKQSILRSKDFGKEIFCAAYDDLLERILKK